MTETLKAPFPWFGGKSRVASLVWDRFGDAGNYVEPFGGSLAVLLGRPTKPCVETVNDKDCHLINFWRSIKHAPDQVAVAADWPVTEADLTARHLWLMSTGLERIEKLKTDPFHYDAQVAGWWVWGISIWIGGGWCNGAHGAAPPQIPHLGPNMGVHQKLDTGENERGNHKKYISNLPYMSSAGQGINVLAMDRGKAIEAYFLKLADRLRDVRVACGDWTRVLTMPVTTNHGVTAVFLDPPYSNDEQMVRYEKNAIDVAMPVREWCLEHGDDPELRIALCGYEGEHTLPESWECVPWKATGGLGSRTGDGRGRANAARERIWFSPHCLKSPLMTFMEEPEISAKPYVPLVLRKEEAAEESPFTAVKSEPDLSLFGDW